MRDTKPLRRGVSIRLRLTLLYTAILALTLIAFSTLLYFAQFQAAYSAVRENLMRQAQDFARHQSFPNPGDAPDMRPPMQDLPTGTLRGRWTQVRDAGGAVIGRTLDLSGAELPLSPAGLAAVQAGQGWFETTTFEDQPVMIYSMPFTGEEGTRQIVQSASPIGQAEQALAALRYALIAGSVAAIMLAFFLGWVFAGTALDPIHRITQTARAIGAERDVSRRVAYDGPGDEVGQLAVTFNVMLAELESAYRQLEASLESQKRFVADASHELRTPLTTVRGNIELLRRQPPLPAAERAEIVADTTDEVERLIRLVNQLLVLARADAGQALALDAVPVSPLLEETCKQARSLAPGREVTCVADADAHVTANRDSLKQVLLILLDNAARHTQPGSAMAVSVEPNGEHVAIRVSDNGPGIAEKTLPHIFERFYRGDTARSGGGAGLGLAIAKELVELQGGAITVASETGRGTTFTVTLPAAGES